ncbi:MAG: T9SS type A sorting domain-containing protein, partial [Bacteroidota bacterium]
DGNYIINATAFDNDGNSQNSSLRNITVGNISQTIQKRISSSMNDVEERSNGDMYTNSSDIELVYDGSRGNQVIGLRFTDLNIPQGATIDNAYIQFTVDETNTGGTSLSIRAHDTNDAPAFTTSSRNVSNRTRTSANVSWNPSSWSSVGAAGSAQRTPQLKSVVQEVIDRSGWVSGNDLAIIITGTGERTAESYDGSSSRAPLLQIEYTIGGNTPTECDSYNALNESFESNFGSWNNVGGDDINWTRRSGTTPSNGTGPNSAYTGSYYAYIEASSPNYPSKVANLVSDCIDLSTLPNPEFSFRYHMYGGNVGTLRVQVSDNGSNWSTVWTKSGNQGNDWNEAKISLATYATSENISIRFNGTTGSSWQGDIVIDGVSLAQASNSSNSCASSSNDGFEASGSWFNASGDDIDWASNTGGTPSRDTGPSAAASGSTYVYVETSSPNYPSKVANLVSGCYDLTQVSNPTISFNYHMYGGSMGTLNLQVRSDGGNWNTIWSISGNRGTNWLSDAISLIDYASSSDVEIRFNAISGSSWQSDIALDNIIVGSNTGSNARTETRNEGIVEEVDLGEEFEESLPSILVFPNPAKEHIELSFDQTWDGGTLSIYGINGSLILEKQLNYKNESIIIKNNELKPGIYLFKIQNLDQNKTIKVIKN